MSEGCHAAVSPWVIAAAALVLYGGPLLHAWLGGILHRRRLHRIIHGRSQS